MVDFLCQKCNYNCLIYNKVIVGFILFSILKKTGIYTLMQNTFFLDISFK